MTVISPISNGRACCAEGGVDVIVSFPVSVSRMVLTKAYADRPGFALAGLFGSPAYRYSTVGSHIPIPGNMYSRKIATT